MKVFGAANHTRESYPKSYPRIIPPNHTSSQTFPSGHGLNGNSHIVYMYYIYVSIYYMQIHLVLSSHVRCETANIASGVAGHESTKEPTTQEGGATRQETEG